MKGNVKIFLGSITSGIVVGCIYGGVKKAILKKHIKELEKIRDEMEAKLEEMKELEQTLQRINELDNEAKKNDDIFRNQVNRLKIVSDRLTSY